MKSPWKYLVQLASLGRTVKEQDRPHEIKSEEPEGSVADRIVGASDDEVVDDLSTATTDAADVSVGRNQGVPTTTIHRASPDEHPASPPTKRQRRSRKTGVSDVEVADIEYEAGGTRAPPRPTTFIDEMTVLDEEIRQLRRRLSEKLLLQNKQLKKMIARFDA
ncbi:hypothetical protein IB279_35215 [Ensifer sp. ENS06]|uniref:hypothetical protein n=1 Tax=Ensifer sp. ENS06 TaxID=2769276 RepID=UPI00177CB9B0|nr:hypothetical protein [Ensifer sp. ENS06]MBD9628202.1 hypothetical protein [Ensifer sp. ENS06]